MKILLITGLMNPYINEMKNELFGTDDAQMIHVDSMGRFQEELQQGADAILIKEPLPLGMDNHALMVQIARKGLLEHTICISADARDMDYYQGLGIRCIMESESEPLDVISILKTEEESKDNVVQDEKAKEESKKERDLASKSLMITIASMKGGVGKTTLSMELAFLLASRAKEIQYLSPEGNVHRNLRVCLVDLNPSYDTMVATLTCVHTRMTYPTVSEWLKKIHSEPPHDFTSKEIESLLVQDGDSGLYILPGLREPEDADGTVLQDIRKILIELREFFDIILVDTGNNTSIFTMASIQESDEIFLVTTPAIGSSVVVGKVIRWLKENDVDMDKLNLVVNSCNGPQTNLKPELIAEVLNVPLVAILPFEEQVRLSYENGEAYSINQRNSRFTRQLVKLAAEICPLWKKKESRKNRFLGWFRGER